VSFGLAFLARCSEAGRGCVCPLLFNILPLQLVSTNHRSGIEFDRNGGLVDNGRVKQEHSEIHRARKRSFRIKVHTVKTITNISSHQILSSVTDGVGVVKHRGPSKMYLRYPQYKARCVVCV
jgi:hypothetical protein